MASRKQPRQCLKDGWFYTGDVGHMDKDGHLYITDRKKDLFKLSNGKYVAPQLIESLLKQSEFVSQVVVVGAGRKQPVALIVPDWESLNEALTESGEKCAEGSCRVEQVCAGDQDRSARYCEVNG